MKTIELVSELEKYGIKASVQRMAIMHYLLTHRTHPTVDEIFTALAPKYPTLSRTTVYNTLKLFVEHGATQMLTIDEKVTCFDGDVTPHAHFLCRRCGRILDIPLQNIGGEDFSHMTIDGNQVAEIHQYYKGICKMCLQELEKGLEIEENNI